MLRLKEFIERNSNFELNENVGDAINDLVDRIRNDGYEKGLEKEVADEWEINSALLVRMFKQKYNKEPKDMAVTNVSKDDAKVIEVAKQKAKEYRNSFSGQFDKYVGKVFQRPDRTDKKYVFVAWTGKDIHAISTPKQEEIRIVFPNARSAAAFLDKYVIN